VRDLTHKLQNFYDELTAGERPVLIIESPPQHGKSSVIVDFISWIAGKHPEFKTIYSSFSERLGVRANLSLQRLYTRKVYKDIFPETQINQKNVVSGTSYLRNREILEYVDKGGSFRNTTVQGSITGESLDLGVIDDPLKGRKEANSETTRNSVWEWLTDDFLTRFSENAGLLMILTRWHIDDPAARLIKEDKSVKVLKYKAIAEEDEEHRKEGEALFPEHKSLEFLLKRKKIMGQNFEALYQQNPLVRGGNLFKTEWIHYVSRGVIEGIKFDKKFITVDSALKDKEKNDYTVYDCFGVLGQKLYLLDKYRGKPRSKEREITAKEFYNKHKGFPFSGMYIEQKASGIDLFQRMKDDGYMVFEVERNTDKVFRAENIAPYLETYGLYVAEDLPHLTEFITEYQAFPNGKHDDNIDTLMDGVEKTHLKIEIDYEELM
jgi:predicted phage terminase large subunit-like protein